MQTHRLKTWPRFFHAILDGDKTFEVRRDDRCFAVGDVLVLREWNPHTETYTGSEIRRVVTYLMRGATTGVASAIRVGFCVMGLGETEDARD